MSAKKKGKKSMGKKSMKKTKGGAYEGYLQATPILSPGDAALPMEQLSLNYKKLK